MSQTTRDLDVGVVYQRRGRFLLAATPDLLIGARGGEPFKTKPRVSDTVVRGCNVASLCQHWGVDLETLDDWTREVLPRPRPKRTRYRGTRRSSAEREFVWQRLRLHRRAS